MLPFPQDPMLARPVSALPQPGALPGGCAYEPKFDGYRALLFVTEDRCRVQSRRGHDITDSFPDVAAASAEQLPAGLVLDGELVVWGDGTLDFAALQRRLGRGAKAALGRTRPASFVAFDVLEVADVDVRPRPLSTRRALLETALDGVEGAIQLAPHTRDVDTAREWMDDYQAADVGVEGLVVKGLATPYRGGAREWQKYRIRDTAEAVVGGAAGSLNQPGHLVLGRLDADGVLRMIGTTVELSTADRREIGALLAPPADGHPWEEESLNGTRWGRTSRQQVHLVDPTLVVEVSTDNSVDRGRWRHPTRFVRARPDLGVDEISTFDEG